MISEFRVNTFGFYSLNGNNIIEFHDHSKIEDFESFLTRIRNDNGNKKIIVIPDNFPTH